MPSSANAFLTVEQVLKEFSAYIEGVRSKFSVQDDGNDWNSPIVLVDGAIDAHDMNRIPWTSGEADRHRDRLKLYGRAMGEQMHRIPKENKVVRRILEIMKRAIREGLQKDGPYHRRHVLLLAENIPSLLSVVQPVDLEILIDLMKSNQRAGDTMDGKEVLLLLGSAGSGKTTTLHFMAGTSFAEVEADGFTHLQPTSFLDPSIAGYKTSCGREAVTSVIQTAQVNVDGVDLVICDTPGFGEAEGVEEDIANGLGIVRALHRAKNVRPVLVLSREGMGDRFSAFSETLTSVTRLIGNAESVDLKPFNYIFTKYEKRHHTCMCRQFMLINKRPRAVDEEIAIFKSFVDDIVTKTTPEAKIALPLEGGSHTLLRSLKGDDFLVQDPKSYFVPFVSEAALRKLKLQLQITLRDVMTSLVEDDYALAVYRMGQLSNLAVALPEAGECAQLGLEATLRHIGATRERIVTTVENILQVKVHKHFNQLLEALKPDIKKLIASEPLRLVCELFEKESHTKTPRTPSASESFCREQVQKLINFVSQDIPEFDPAFLNIEALMRKRGSFLTGVIRLKEMSEVLRHIPGDEDVCRTYRRAFSHFYTFVDCVLQEAERTFQSTPKDLQSFERQAWFLAVLIQGFLNKPNSGTGEHAKMEELENRRLKLMLRLEIKITDTIELVTNTRFPDGNEDDSSPDSLPVVKLSGLWGPRQLLLNVSQLPRLCRFLPSKIESAKVEKSVSVLDKKIVNFMFTSTVKAESIFNRLDAMISQQALTSSIKAAVSARHDLKLVIEEFSGARCWSKEIEERTVDTFDRLLIVLDAIEASIVSMEVNLGQQKDGATVVGFSCGVLPYSYSCAQKQCL